MSPWFLCFSLQLLIYEKDQRREPDGFSKGRHRDPDAYVHIAVLGIKGTGLIQVCTPDKKTILREVEVHEGQMYVMSGSVVDPLTHGVVCIGETDRIVAVLRFIKRSTLLSVYEAL